MFTPEFQKPPSEKMDFKFTMSVTVNSIFFPALHHNCLTCLFSERDIMTTWKCWVKVYIYVYIQWQGTAFLKTRQAPPHSWKELQDLGKRHHFGLSFQRNVIQLQQWTEHHYLGCTCWATRLPSCQKSTSIQTYQLRSSQNAELSSKSQRSICSFNHFSPLVLCRSVQADGSARSS